MLFTGRRTLPHFCRNKQQVDSFGAREGFRAGMLLKEATLVHQLGRRKMQGSQENTRAIQHGKKRQTVPQLIKGGWRITLGGILTQI